MSRNKDRLGMGDTTPEHASPPVAAMDTNVFSFVAPTEFVKLPSEGKYYPPNHPLYNQTTIEIKQMTAKEEDILTSMTLLQNGVALERLLESIIVNKSIHPNSLLVGDRNAIIISTRVSGYGNIYKTKITCPNCLTEQNNNFDLNTAQITSASDILERLPDEISHNDDGTFSIILPKSQLNITLKLLVGSDERSLADRIQKNENGVVDRIVTTQLKHMIAAVNGNSTREAIDYVSDNLPSSDSTFLRGIYKTIVPNIKLNLDFTCSNCSHSEEMEVPLTAEFFWPQQ